MRICSTFEASKRELISTLYTGDGRASEQPGLTAIHTIFMREHNRVADGLRAVNPGWEDERIYQQARRIVNAEYQHITYKEFLPRILGHTAMNLYGLSLESPGEYFKGKKLYINYPGISCFMRTKKKMLKIRAL